MPYEEGREIGERLQPCVGALRAGRTFFLGSLAKNPLNTCFTLLTAEFCGYFHIKCFFFFIYFLIFPSQGSAEELQGGERSAEVGAVGEPGCGEAERRGCLPEPSHGHCELAVCSEVRLKTGP